MAHFAQAIEVLKTYEFEEKRGTTRSCASRSASAA